MKIDGLSLALTFENRLLAWAQRAVMAVAAKTSPPTFERSVQFLSRYAEADGTHEVRGEVYFPRAFERMNRGQEEAGEQLFANPRIRPRAPCGI